MNDLELLRRLRALKSDGPPPRDGFTDSVMQKVAARKRPRAPVRWVPAALAVAAVVALIALHQHRRLPPPAPSDTPAEAQVRFTLDARQASRVSVAGDFNDWRPEATPLQRAADGQWTVTVSLPPGSWAYSFIVDGAPMADPRAETFRDDGFGGKNAIVRVGDRG